MFHHCLLLIHSEGFTANETWVADETELKANANKRVRESVTEKKVIEEKEEDLKRINDVRERHGLKPLKPKELKTAMRPCRSSMTSGEGLPILSTEWSTLSTRLLSRQR